MSTTPNGNIDVDALIHTLLNEKNGDETAEAPAVVEMPQTAETEPPVLADEETAAEEEPAAQPSVPAKAPKAKKNGRLRNLLEKKRVEEEEEEDAFFGLKPIGHYHMKDPKESRPTVTDEAESPAQEAETPQEKKPKNDEFPAVKAVAETITMQVVLPSGQAIPRTEQHTRVVPVVKVEEDSPVAEESPVEPSTEPERPMQTQLPDQLSLEEMVRVEDIEESTAPVEDDTTPEERYEQSRREKVREFTLRGEEEFNDPEEEVAAEEPEPEDLEVSFFVRETSRYRNRSLRVVICILPLFM